MKKIIALSCCATLLILWSGGSMTGLFLDNGSEHRSPPGRPHESILLKSRIIDPGASPAAAARADGGHVIVQLDHLPSESEKQQLAAGGITLLEYVPHRAWIARIEPGALSNQHVSFIGSLLPDDKVSRFVGRRLGTDEPLNVTVVFFASSSRDEAASLVGRYGTPLEENDGFWTMESDGLRLSRLAEEDAVRWIEQAPFPPAEANDGARDVIEVDVIQAAPYGLNGSGVVLGEWDSGYANHSDFLSRATRGDPGEGSNQQHSTHVAGTMLGDGNMSSYRGGSALQWGGMAINATLITYEWPNSATEAQDETNHSVAVYGASLSTNSWSYTVTNSNCDAVMGDIDSWTQVYDNATRGGRVDGKIIIVFAAGNTRDDSVCNSSARLYNTTTGPGATGKNVIAVGAVTKAQVMSTFSAWGPTDDGRIKPDVVAVGVSVKSTIPTETYGSLSGTSMSTPGVSGAIGLLIQAYRANHSSQNPLPSTVRAILLHTAKDLNETGPDFTTGYGLVNASRAADTIQQDVNGTETIVENVINGTGANVTYLVNLRGNETDLRLTLAWDDYPSTLGAAKDLINDLDLAVTAPNGSRYFPWTLDPVLPWLPAVTNATDTLNTMEQVVVSSPAAGVWTIVVNGTSVPQPDQNFSLVSSANLNVTSPVVNLTSPLSGAVTGTSVTFECNATDSQGLKNLTLYTNISGWAANETVNVSGTANGSSFIVSGIVEGQYVWNCQAHNTANLSAFAPGNSSFTASIAPAWSGNVSSTPSTFSPTTASLFNVTWTDDNGVAAAVIQLNVTGTPVNFSMTRVGSTNVYTFSAILSGGTSSWRSFANDTLGKLNATAGYDFTIAAAAANLSLLLNGTAGNLSMLEDGQLNLTATLSPNATLLLLVNGTLGGNASGRVENINTFPTPGTYNITGMFEGNGNYTAASATFWLTVNDTTAPAIHQATLSAPLAVVGENITITANVTDNAAVAAVTYNVTNATTSISGLLHASGGAFNGSLNTSTLSGLYSVTVLANDSAGNAANLSAGSFRVTSAVTTTFTVVGRTGNATNATSIRILHNGTTTLRTQSGKNSTFTASLPTGLFDIAFETADFNATFFEMNASVGLNANLSVDSGINVTSGVPAALLAFRKTVALETGLNFTVTTVGIPYNATLFTSTARVHPYACHAWNISSQTCSGSWMDILANATVSTSPPFVNINASNLSAFALGENFTCGDAVCDSSESCSSCSGDCGGCIGEAGSGSGGSSSGGGGGGGGGSASPTATSCTERWECTGWTSCLEGRQTRICSDSNGCGTTAGKPTESQACPVCGDGRCDEGEAECRADCPPAPAARACDPGSRTCRGDEVVVCSPDGTRWVAAETCTFGCADGVCRPQPLQAPAGRFFAEQPALLAAIIGALAVAAAVGVIVALRGTHSKARITLLYL